MAKKADLRHQTLSEFLANKNLPSDLKLPWVHSSSAANLFDIIDAEKLLAVPCNVFKGDKLVYFFVGRPAYKMPAVENPSEWQLPIVFVMRFQQPPNIKRVFPFDSGAFLTGRMPNYISMFPIAGYEMSRHPDLAGRLVSFFFKTQERYFFRRPAGDEEMKVEHELDMRHAQILALAKLYRDRESATLDDRAAAIEVSVAEDVPLEKSSLLGVVIPNEYKRLPGMVSSLKGVTQIIEGYDLLPLGTDAHYGVVYDCVKRIYKKAGIKL